MFVFYFIFFFLPEHLSRLSKQCERAGALNSNTLNVSIYLTLHIVLAAAAARRTMFLCMCASVKKDKHWYMDNCITRYGKFSKHSRSLYGCLCMHK